ncbi:MAG: hypothetical protein ABIK07_00725, partial [Planctomycetota bacterium]
MTVRVLILLCMITVSFSSGFAQAVVEKPAVTASQRAGGPLAATRRTAINALPFQRPLDAEKIKKWLEISSQCTMAEFELFLSPLSQEEQELLKVIEDKPVPIVN